MRFYYEIIQKGFNTNETFIYSLIKNKIEDNKVSFLITSISELSMHSKLQIKIVEKSLQKLNDNKIISVKKYKNKKKKIELLE